MPTSFADPYGDVGDDGYSGGGSVEEPSGSGFGGGQTSDSNGFGGEHPTESGGFGGGQPGDDNGFGGEHPTESGGFGGGQPGDDNGFGGEHPTESGGFGGGQPGDDNGFGGENPGQNGGFGSGEPSESGDRGDPVPTVSAAPQTDVTRANDAEVVVIHSTTMSSEQTTSYWESVSQSFTSSSYSTGGILTSPVTLWNSAWTAYDRFYRPVFTNPYPNPMQIMYTMAGQPQMLTVPPFQRAVLNTSAPGVYSFTSMTQPPSGAPTNASVGSFTGGGYVPAPGQPPPAKPEIPQQQKNVLVKVKFASGESQPFRVNSLIDLGKDPDVNNLSRVLLDEEIPAWGQWGISQQGEREFDVTETQLMPGLKPPSQDPIPGYKVQLVAKHAPQSWIEANQTPIVVAGAAAGALALAGIGFMIMRRRKAADEA
jgi:hypothetical protein